ncbi:hypothetical protein [Sulfitobacter sabulilitoris]|uniref:Argininosuccinate lyase n=1 Tax=Sulfitobacter sabulilitoris TaxID=2562655 RepID=A0A5S3PCJ6_9RHOB|nr:hypothetical protein [Sulfitobacter sabulilitoris]TMM51577.1 hypothetical protein FDT80_12510 [Sulfitobacter sabulilitoris]
MTRLLILAAALALAGCTGPDGARDTAPRATSGAADRAVSEYRPGVHVSGTASVGVVKRY